MSEAVFPARLHNDSPESREPEERGVVMLILAIVIFTVVMFSAIGLDLSQMSVSSQEASNYAKFAALSALQGYSTAPAGSTTAQKLARALQSANDVDRKSVV